ncbi:MAG: hypothetical protein GXP05_01760 [Alphaproteobacteria bacterium]|nr:hypothetical protein [Alphaproteobacteria bacterium]
MLAKMGSLLELEPCKPKSEVLHDLKEMLTGKRALIKDRTAAAARLATATHQVLKQQISRRLRQISKDLEQIDGATSEQRPGFRAIILAALAGGWGEVALKPQGFSSLDHAHKNKRTKRAIFLGEMDAVVPWAHWKRRFRRIGPSRVKVARRCRLLEKHKLP